MRDPVVVRDLRRLEKIGDETGKGAGAWEQDTDPFAFRFGEKLRRQRDNRACLFSIIAADEEMNGGAFVFVAARELISSSNRLGRAKMLFPRDRKSTRLNSSHRT